MIPNSLSFVESLLLADRLEQGCRIREHSAKSKRSKYEHQNRHRWTGFWLDGESTGLLFWSKSTTDDDDALVGIGIGDTSIEKSVTYSLIVKSFGLIKDLFELVGGVLIFFIEDILLKPN
jgi:hypothetical protein